MVPRILIDTAEVPGGEMLKLYRRGDEFSIMLGGNELMNSRLSGSEEALATLACERIGDRTAPHLLVGGLGMGFTLRAALQNLPPAAHVTVAELVPAVIAWARGPMVPVFQGCLEDPRVALVEEDVGLSIAQRRSAWDAILLDVDNGPDGLTRQENDGLYGAAGLEAAWAALKPGGILAIWSAAPDSKIMRRLERSGFAAEEHVVKARGSRGARHLIWLGTRR